MPARELSWGRYPRVDQHAIDVQDRDASLPDFAGLGLPRGNGRSYGDSCLLPGGTLLRARGLDRFIGFNPATGILECEAGLLLDEIITLTLPQGWFLPVTPGTRYVTVGGAIANDVHGKNHHRTGTFGEHVVELELLRSDGGRERLCRTGEVDDLFAATVGGLGLTGLITRATLQLRRVPGPWMEAENIRFGSLGDFFALSQESEQTHEYGVAWIDCLARGASRGRGYFTRADHASMNSERLPAAAKGHLAIPLTPPFSLVNRLTLRPFNLLHYWRQGAGSRRSATHLMSYFYPLDRVRNWNVMYGPRGFLQYQCVIPPDHAQAGIAALLDEIARSGQGSFLAVLKKFGDRAPVGMLSFPRPGTTLALDFPNTGDSVFRLLDRLDRVVDDAGGAIYPAKDARMSAATFRRGYPCLQAFSRHIDPRFTSGFWRRVTE